MNIALHIPALSPAHIIRAKHPKARVGLIRAREDLGLSRPEFGRLIGMSRFAVFRIEMGQATPTFVKMCKWVDELGPGAALNLFRIQES